MLFIRQSYGGDDTGEKIRIFNGVRCMSAKFSNFAYDNGIYFNFSMNKWQKIVGVIAFGVIGIYELLLWSGTYLDLKYLIEPYDIPDITERMYLRANSLSVALWLNYFIALCMFICLWRKGSKE